MTTRERIIQESLTLFAKKGYDGVSVREIAKAVNVRESALYKHFKNKEDILQKVVEEIRSRITESYTENQIPEVIEKDNIAAGYRRLSTDDLCTISWNLFQLYTKEPTISNFRKLLMREQFDNPYIARQYNELFVEGAVKRQAQTFKALVEDGFFKKEDPEIMALHFYGPIQLLFQEFDCQPEREAEIKEKLINHVKVFGANFEQKHS